MQIELLSPADVSQDVSPQERMFTGNLDHYLHVGKSALSCIAVALQASGRRPEDVHRVLDLPCGHGRVLRYLRAAFANAEITACDLLRDGVDYCARQFAAVPLYSCPDPTAIALASGPFDLVWMGSLFTHFDHDQWASFLGVLAGKLAPGGVLVFTTHGRRSHHWLSTGRCSYDLDPGRVAALLRSYEESGFGYVDYPGSQERYGVSLSSGAWVMALLARLGHLRVTYLGENAWDNHQDCFACVPDSDFRPTGRYPAPSAFRPLTSLVRRVRAALRQS